MWLIASKLLGYLLSPLPFTVLMVCFGAVLGWLGAKRTGRFFKVTGFVLLLVCSLPFTERLMRIQLENQYPPVDIQASPSASMIVVLGGAVAMPYPPRLEVELHDSSDRVLHAFRLYKAGKAPLIFLSAGNVIAEQGEVSEAEYIADLLVEWGIPAAAIVIERNSRTTRENAYYTFEHLKSRGDAAAPVLLVTSALHMPRAVTVFRKAGVNVIPSTTDVSAGPEVLGGFFDWLPSIGALNGFTNAWHEYLGSWVYRARGWV